MPNRSAQVSRCVFIPCLILGLAIPEVLPSRAAAATVSGKIQFEKVPYLDFRNLT